MYLRLSAFLLLFVPSLALAATLPLGTVRLTDAPDRDVLALPGCDGPENALATRLQLRVAEHAARIVHLDVRFHNGDQQTIRLRKDFRKGAESRWIDLDGPARCIARIRIGGDAQTLGRTPGKQARVSFFADVAQLPERAEGDGVVLGRMALADATDRDVVDLPACASPANRPVTSIKVRVVEYPVEINRLRVVFHNGDDVTVDLNQTFGAGESSEWKDLPGDARCIDQIIVIGDTQTPGHKPGKQARLVFFGR